MAFPNIDSKSLKSRLITCNRQKWHPWLTICWRRLNLPNTTEPRPLDGPSSLMFLTWVASFFVLLIYDVIIVFYWLMTSYLCFIDKWCHILLVNYIEFVFHCLWRHNFSRFCFWKVPSRDLLVKKHAKSICRRLLSTKRLVFHFFYYYDVIIVFATLDVSFYCQTTASKGKTIGQETFNPRRAHLAPT